MSKFRKNRKNRSEYKGNEKKSNNKNWIVKTKRSINNLPKKYMLEKRLVSSSVKEEEKYRKCNNVLDKIVWIRVTCKVESLH